MGVVVSVVGAGVGAVNTFSEVVCWVLSMPRDVNEVCRDMTVVPVPEEPAAIVVTPVSITIGPVRGAVV